MRVSSCGDPRNIVVEFPHELRRILESGGAELVEEIREEQNGAADAPNHSVHKRLLLALDEDERRERLSKSEGSNSNLQGADQQYLDALREARKCLVSDAKLLEGFLFSKEDAAMWPNIAVLSDAVRCRSLCLQYEGDDETATSLEAAVEIHQAECQLPGRYELVQAPLASETHMTMLKTTADAHDGLIVSMNTVEEDPRMYCREVPLLFKVSGSSKSWPLSEVVSLKVPASVDAKLQLFLAAHCGGESGTPKSFMDVARLHRKAASISSAVDSAATMGGGCGGSLFTPRDFITRFTMPPADLVKKLSESEVAVDQQHKVRLRSGLFLSFVDVNEMFIVFRHIRGAKQLEYSSFDEEFSSETSDHIHTMAESSGRRAEWADALEHHSLVVMRGARRNTLQLASLLASSLLPASSWPPSVAEVYTSPALPDIEIHFVSFSKGNVYGIVYGPRAEETIPCDEVIYKSLKLDLAAAQEKAEQRREEKRAEELRNKKRSREDASTPSTPNDPLSASAIRSASVIQDADRVLSDLSLAINIILNKKPSTFEQILRAPEVEEFRTGRRLIPGGDFKMAVRDVLRANASYEGREYYWKVM